MSKEQQPIAGEFTKELRRRVTEYRKLVSPFAQDTISILSRAVKACDRLDTAEAFKIDLLTACRNSPAPIWFSEYAKFAEECSEKPNMGVYKRRFISMATFLRSCVDRAEKMEAAIAKAKRGRE